MSGTVTLHLFERRGWIIQNDASATRSMTVFVHPDPTTRACGKLDVIFCCKLASCRCDALLASSVM